MMSILSSQVILIHLQIDGAKENVKLHKLDENVNKSPCQPFFANGNSSYLHRLTTVNHYYSQLARGCQGGFRHHLSVHT